MDPSARRTWHAVFAGEAVGALGSDADQGLDGAEAGRRLAEFGPNAVTPRREKGPLLRFALQFHQPLVYLLLVAGAGTAALGEWIDAGVIFAVVWINAAVGFVQESKAVRALAALARTLTTEATVVRDGAATRVPSTQVVPGDLVLLQAGDKVPADLRLVRCRDLQVDESALTGESVPVEKDPGALAPDTSLADRRNLAFASTLVTCGQGAGVVVATGDRTEVGRISRLLAETRELETPLTRRIAAFSRVLVVVVLALAAITFAVGLARGQSPFELFLAAVALAVGAIPEGLPAAVTIILAIGVARMARRRAIIRKLPAVEALGSTTVICSDKTGTLTENQMTVREVWLEGGAFQVTGAGYAPDGEFCGVASGAVPGEDGRLAECLRCGLVCNDSRLAEEGGRWSVQGDPTEGARLAAAGKLGLEARAEAGRLPRLDAIPFDSRHQYMATLHDAGPGRPRIVYLKGAVEAVLERCSPGGRAGEPEAAGAALRAAEEMAARGLRVLAFARGSAPPGMGRVTHAGVAGGLSFLGLQGMLDPPRPEAAEAVRACRRAGIRVKMITGDHALTGAAIAREIGIGVAPGGSAWPRAVTGRELEGLSGAELAARAADTDVFARVTPEQKLRLVEALQAQGHVVAMTGDGVNDAPALKRADIGVAMGITGTEVAKEAAAMVLTDDNFATIEAAVEEGRAVFDNLVKFLVWTLPTNLGLAFVLMAAIFAGVTLPMLPVQILWINMTTVVLLGTTLAFEAREPGIMDRPPRDPAAPIMTAALAGRIVLVGTLLLLGAFGLFEWQALAGASVAEARTVAVNVFVAVGIGYLFNCRSLVGPLHRTPLRDNPWALGGALAMLGLQLAFTYAPFMNRFFRSAPIGPGEWAAIGAVAAATCLVVEGEKGLRRRAARHQGAGAP
ncbi:MAG: HAD-IC family P-type ATPase [Thermodesulfobacteriota bacterium]